MRKHLSTSTINKCGELYGMERKYFLGILKESNKHFLKRVISKAKEINKTLKEMNIMH
jgi:hypothetical protein